MERKRIRKKWKRKKGEERRKGRGKKDRKKGRERETLILQYKRKKTFNKKFMNWNKAKKKSIVDNELLTSLY